MSSDMMTIYEGLMEGTGEKNAVRVADNSEIHAEIYRLSKAEELINRRFRMEIFGYIQAGEARELATDLDIEFRDLPSFRQKLLEIPWDNNPLAEIICDFLGVPKYILGSTQKIQQELPRFAIPWPDKLDYLEEMGTEIITSKPHFKNLKYYQSTIFSEVKQTLNQAFVKCLICMPTGTGKTRTAMQLVCEYLNENPNRSVIWVADKRELIDQACAAFIETWEFVGNRPLPIGRWYSGSEDHELHNSMFLATTFGTLLHRSDEVRELPVGLILIDEAHRAPAENWGRELRRMIDPAHQTRMIGLTATPIRGGDDTGNLLKFFPKYHQIHNPSTGSLIHWLESEGFLAYPNYVQVELDVEITLPPPVRKALDDGNDYTSDFLQVLAKQVVYNRRIATELIKLLNNHDSILFFSPSVQHSKMIVTWLRSRGFAAAHIDGETRPDIRHATIESFRKKEIQVLSNYSVLDTGFDAPQVDCVFMARPTTSPVVYHQILGRGLRGPALGGTKECTVVDVPFNFETYGSKREQSFTEYQRIWDRASDALE
jgi:DNA repair protein RadD